MSSDEITVVWNDFDTIIKSVQTVLLVRQVNLQVKVSKCKLLQTQAVLLGYLLSQKEVIGDLTG